ncbi:MAG TPA: hypothetical protein VJ998_11370, partial [Pseudomonadales bacterium]|nr:hypothetical protein [Pseudomonadales bacterium]
MFDALAPSYDTTFSGTKLGILLRQNVWRHMAPLLKGARRVADIGCGTGVDAAWLARLGVQV